MKTTNIGYECSKYDLFVTRQEILDAMEQHGGSEVYYNGEKYFVPADEALEIVDTTGCGDSYHAGFVCSHMLIGDIYEAMRVGTEFATETLSHYGGF